MSLESQGVVNGDRIVLHPVNSPSSKRRPTRTSDVDPTGTLFLEMLRLADVSFVPYELAICADIGYQQLLLEEHQDDEETVEVQPPTVIGETPQSVSSDRLPVLWETDEEEEEHQED
jgi:hypothetical protein